MLLQILHFPKKRTFWGDTNRPLLTLGGAGGQTVETRSTFGVRLKSLGYNASNGLCGKLYLLFKSFYLNKNFKLLNLLVLSYRTKIDVLFCHDNVSDLLISYSYLKVVDAMQVVPVLEMRKECCQMELNVSLALMQYRCVSCVIDV